MASGSRSFSRAARLLDLLELLLSSTPRTSTELSLELGTSERTVNRDVKALDESGFAIVRDKATRTITIERDTFLQPLDLTMAETLVLLTSASAFGDRNCVPGLHALRTAADKMAAKLPAPLQEYVAWINERTRISLGPRSQPERAGVWYEFFRDATAKRKSVVMTYASIWDGGTIETTLSPYFLTFHRRAWYCVGKSSLHNETRTFHLGRVTTATTTGKSYRIPKSATPAKYFGNAWSMIGEGKTSTVKIWFTPKVAPNVADVQWHHTQSFTWNDDESCVMTVRVDGLDEISWWILGYGDQAEVLQPKALRAKLRGHAEAMAKRYAE